jgi:AsmA protein
MHSLDGRGQLKLADGEVSGLDLEQALRRVEKRPLSIATEVRTGRTSFTSASGAFNVSDGNAEMEQCVASGPGVELAMTGSSEIGDRSLDLHVVARQTGAEATNADAPQLHLDLMGSWDDPLLVLDTASLIRRSQVAAPLLRSLAPASIPSGTPASTALGAPSASAAPTR